MGTDWVRFTVLSTSMSAFYPRPHKHNTH